MVVEVTLNKVLTQGTTYRTHPRVCYVVQKIGTNSTSSGYLVIDGKVTGAIIADIAPIRKTSSYVYGPLDISRLPYVIPPDTSFYWNGASGSDVRLIGKILQLAPGEVVPESLLARYREQPDKHIKYVSGSYSFGTDTAWSDGTEVTILTLTPTTIEKYKFNDLVVVDIANATISDGDVVLKFYVDNNPLEFLESNNVEAGLDILAFPHRDDVATNEVAFSLKDLPILLEGDHTLKVTAKNVSGSAISPPSGTSITLTLYMVGEYSKGVA